MNQWFQSFQTHRSHQVSISFSNKIGDNNINNIFTDNKVTADLGDDNTRDKRVKNIQYKSIDLKSN